MSGNAAGSGQGAPAGPADALQCVNPQCRRREGMLKAEIDRLAARIQELELEGQGKAAEIRELRNEKSALKTENDALKARRAGQGKHTERTWPEVLRGYLLNFHPNKIQYGKIYRLCCKEENMSVKVHWVHPDLKFVGPRQLLQDDSDSETNSSDMELEGVPEVVLEDGSIQTARDEKPFAFEKLPWEVQAEILKLILHKEGKIVHCISRLDPFVQPEDSPNNEELGNRSGLMHRFYWGEREMNLTEDGVKPEDVLGILQVSKRIFFLGVHIFYGLNTFGFSSLGELGRFCQGSGLARVARIQHIEFFLTGNQYLTAPLDTRKKTPFSRRTFALTWLVDMYRLKTLVVHLNETGTQYIRRGYEAPAIKKLLAAKTAGQPNQRMARSLRCLQGVDYIYQLRGLEWVRFYDFNKVLQTGDNVRKPVQDWSFVEDVTNTTTLPKAPVREEHAKVENLEPLLKGEGQNWTPGPDDWELAKSCFIDTNGRCSYDDLRARRANRDADVASFLSVTGTAPVLDISSDSSDSSDSDKDSDDTTLTDSDNPLGLGETASSLLRRQRRPKSALFVSNDDGERDSDSGSLSESDRSTESTDDADSDSSGSELDTAAASHRSFNEIISAHLPSRSLSSGSLIRSDLPSKSASKTPKRRESTASRLFVTPGPARTATRTPSKTPPPRNYGSTSQSHSRRESTTSGLFVTPGPSDPAAGPDPSRTRRESTATTGMFVTPGPSGPQSFVMLSRSVSVEGRDGNGHGGGDGYGGLGGGEEGGLMVEELSSLASDEVSSSESSSGEEESSSEEEGEEDEGGGSSDEGGSGGDNGGGGGTGSLFSGSGGSHGGGSGGGMGSLFSGSDADSGIEGDDEGVGKGWLAGLGVGGGGQLKRSRSRVSKGGPSGSKRPRVEK